MGRRAIILLAYFLPGVLVTCSSASLSLRLRGGSWSGRKFRGHARCCVGRSAPHARKPPHVLRMNKHVSHTGSFGGKAPSASVDIAPAAPPAPSAESGNLKMDESAAPAAVHSTSEGGIPVPKRSEGSASSSVPDDNDLDCAHVPPQESWYRGTLFEENPNSPDGCVGSGSSFIGSRASTCRDVAASTASAVPIVNRNSDVDDGTLSGCTLPEGWKKHKDSLEDAIEHAGGSKAQLARSTSENGQGVGKGSPLKVLISREMSQLSLAETSAAARQKKQKSLTELHANASLAEFLAGSEACKYIYIVSDSTGFTASHALTSVLGQFDTLKINWQASAEEDSETMADKSVVNATEVRTQMFSNVKDADRIRRIALLAQKMRAMVLFTLVEKRLHKEMTRSCHEVGVPSQDLLGPLVSRLASFLDSVPTGRPRASGTRRKPLSDKYFKRVEAVEFTIKQDDGAGTRNLYKADVVLLGVSRSSKTPLSMYLAQQFGYKVANVPLVLGIPPPKEIFQVDPRRVFGLVIQPQFLRRIRTRRLAGTGVDVDTIGKEAGSFDYSSIKYIQQELREVRDLYAQHPEWSVIDVTGRAVEENAAIIAELMPGKPTPVEAALHALDCNFFIIEPTMGQNGKDFPIVFASDGFCQASGYTREEITGKSPTVLHGPQTDQSVIKEVWRHLAEGLEGRFEVTNHRKDHSFFKKTLHLSPVRNQEGDVAFVFCTQCELEPLAPGFNPQQPTAVDGEVVSVLAMTVLSTLALQTACVISKVNRLDAD